MPVSALPLECDALVPDAERALLIGAGSVVNVDEATAPHPDFAMMRQAGVLTCDWDGSEGTSLGAYVLPDGADVYQSSFADEPPSAYNTLDSVGDRSIFYCNSYGEVQCNAYLLVDDYLIEFFWTSSLTDEEASKAVMQDALEGIVDRIRDAGPARELVVLLSGTDAKRVCSDAALEAASAAFDSKVIRSGGDAGSIGFWTSRVQTGAAICLWGAERLSDAIRPLGLPGGAWAIEAWRQTRPDEIVAGLGRDGDGVVTCVPTACYAFAAFGDDLLAFEAPPDDESDMEEIASEFFAALR